ncbi:MAG: hypothetical protein Q9218_001882 [Villophora microphyllina]
MLPSGRRPLSAPPPGVTANLDHPDSNSYRELVTVGICIPLIVIFASLRIYSNVYVYRSRNWHDFTFMLATAWTLIYQGLTLGLLSKGFFGSHIWELRVEDLRNAPFLFTLLLESLYGPFIWLTKLAMFLMYLHLFGTRRYFRYLVWAGVIVSGLYYFSSTIASLALCAPRGKETYIMAFTAHHCNKSKDLAVVTGVYNVMSDFYLFLLPIHETMRIQNTLRKRIKVLAVFMTGFMGVVASIIGLYFRIRVLTLLDTTWFVIPVYLSITVEMTVGIAVCCAPAMHGLYKHYKPCVKTFLGYSNDSGNSQEERHRMKNLSSTGQCSSPRRADFRNKPKHGPRASDDSKIQLCNTTSETEVGSEGYKVTALPEAEGVPG